MELNAEDRRFFSTVAEIIFSNPFDDARAEVRALAPDATRAAAENKKKPAPSSDGPFPGDS